MDAEYHELVGVWKRSSAGNRYSCRNLVAVSEVKTRFTASSMVDSCMKRAIRVAVPYLRPGMGSEGVYYLVSISGESNQRSRCWSRIAARPKPYALTLAIALGR